MQVRAKTDPGTVKRYAQAMRVGAEFPPVEAVELDGVLVLVDGFHRIAAMESIGLTEVSANITPVASLEEARWLAARANLLHGLPLKAGERRGVFRAYMHARQHRRGGQKGALKSYREIAGDIGGASYNTVRNWMLADFPRVFRAMGGQDGAGPGELTEADTPGQRFAKEVHNALDKALAALPGVADPVARGRLLVKVEELAFAIEEAGVEQEAPF